MNRREMLKGMGVLAVADVNSVCTLAHSATDGAPAYRAFKEALQASPDWAWLYHCTIACAAMDEGMRPPAANRVAARFMKAAFDIDTLTGIYKEMGDDATV